jgi:hypothetical protein
MKNFLSIIAGVLLFSNIVTAQELSVSGNVGWASPKGGGISDAAGDLNLDGGLVYSADALYMLKPTLGVGLQYSSAILAGAGGGDVDLFGLRVIGAKGYWALKEEGFSPYAGLTLGLAQLLTPELTITQNGQTSVIPETNGSGFGIMPELGLRFGGFILGVQYTVPTKFTIEEVGITDKAAGSLNYVLGYRKNFSL